MKSEISNLGLRIGLTKMSSFLRLNNIEYFPFFGTLLGLVREGKPIEGDDDIDFYVNISEYENVKSLLLSLGFKIDYGEFPNHTTCFIQASGYLEREFVRIDFYFFDRDIDPDFLIEKWNFLGKPEDPNSFLRLPKPLVFPLREISFFDFIIPVPCYPEIICDYLYGVNWKTPQKKNMDYHVFMLGGRAIRFRRSSNNIQLIH